MAKSPRNVRRSTFLFGMALAHFTAARCAPAADQTELPPNLGTGAAVSLDQPTTIDLSSALRLAGVRNLGIVVAQQRVEAAVAGQQFAAAQLLPNLNAGSNFDAHTGELITPTGALLAVNRSALYIGAGSFAVSSSTPQVPG